MPPEVIARTDMTGSPQAPVQGTQAPARQMATTERPTQAQPEATGTPPVDPQLATRQAEQARQLQVQRRQQRALQQRVQAAEAKTAELEAWKARVLQEPGPALSEAGVSGDQITNSILNQPSAEEIWKQKQERDLQAIKEAQDQQTQASYDQAKKQIRREAEILVNANKAFETTKAMRATEAIVELIEQTFLAPESEGGGFLMSVEDAALEVEEYLVGEALKLAQLEKIKTRLSPAQAQHAGQSMQQQQQANPRSATTLSNRETPTTTPKRTPDRDRRERAILAFQGKI